MTVILANVKSNSIVYACKVSIADYYKSTIDSCDDRFEFKNSYNQILSTHQHKFKRFTMSYKCHNMVRLNAKLFVGENELNGQLPYLLPTQKLENQEIKG